MMMLCPSCQTPIPDGGKFCPKCGQPSPAASVQRKYNSAIAHPPTAPIPKAGKIFFTLLAIGVAMAIGGFTGGMPWIAIAGTALIALCVVVMLVGHAFF